MFWKILLLLFRWRHGIIGIILYTFFILLYIVSMLTRYLLSNSVGSTIDASLIGIGAFKEVSDLHCWLYVYIAILHIWIVNILISPVLRLILQRFELTFVVLFFIVFSERRFHPLIECEFWEITILLMITRVNLYWFLRLLQVLRWLRLGDLHNHVYVFFLTLILGSQGILLRLLLILISLIVILKH